MHDIGIVGAGIGGLHLGLALLQRGITPTLYARYEAQTMRDARLSSTIILFDTARTKSRELGIPMPARQGLMTALEFGIEGMPAMGYQAPASPPFQALDMRGYLPDALELFVERGGRVVTCGELDVDRVRALGQRHDLVVVASGRGTPSKLFPRDEDRSLFSEPKRRVFAGLFRGIKATSPPRFSHVAVPDHGEISEFPFSTFEGEVRALLILAVPGGAMDELTRFDHLQDLRAFEGKVLEVLEEHATSIFERVDPKQFESLGSHHIAQGAVLPEVRKGIAEIDNGRHALALGDAHVTIDPINAQGANMAVKGAHLLAELLEEQVKAKSPFDYDFCKRAEERLWALYQPASNWAAALLSPPQPHVFELAAAVAKHETLAAQMVSNFDDPEAQWRTVGTPEGTAAFIQSAAG